MNQKEKQRRLAVIVLAVQIGHGDAFAPPHLPRDRQVAGLVDGQRWPKQQHDTHQPGPDPEPDWNSRERYGGHARFASGKNHVYLTLVACAKKPWQLKIFWISCFFHDCPQTIPMA